VVPRTSRPPAGARQSHGRTSLDRKTETREASRRARLHRVDRLPRGQRLTLHHAGWRIPLGHSARGASRV